jgi:transcriptional repressor NrdR
MVCPFCLHKKTRVYNSRGNTRLNTTWRRRECEHCKRQFTTYESADPAEILTLRRGNKLERFSHTRLLMSVLRACDHRKELDETVTYLCATIEQKLFLRSLENATGTINRLDIIDIASTVLKNFDSVAYVKYIGRYEQNMPAAALRKALRQEK